MPKNSFSKDLRHFLAGHFAQGVFSFANDLEKVTVGDGVEPYGYLLRDVLQLYDFLVISALGPQTIRFGLAEQKVKKGGIFTNLQFHFQRQNHARLELALSEEPRRRKIQATLLKKMRWNSGRVVDFPFVAISATAWSRSPILTEIITGFELAGKRFFPVRPLESIDGKQFENYFEELEAFQESMSLVEATQQLRRRTS